MRIVAIRDVHRIMRNHADDAIDTAQSLSQECVSAYNEIRSLALAPSSASNLATLLLSLCVHPGQERGELRIYSQFMQEEMAESTPAGRR
jgi:hypothetical protein